MIGDLFLDTYALIYFFEGRPKMAKLISEAATLHYSPITEIELLSARHLIEPEIDHIRNFLSLCHRADLVPAIISETISIRRTYNFKVPDAIIAALAVVLDISLVSADVAFDRVAGLILVSDIL